MWFAFWLIQHYITCGSFFGFFRSDIAWKDAKYAQIWEYLRDEFELTQRFASLDFKLKFVEVWYIQILYPNISFPKKHFWFKTWISVFRLSITTDPLIFVTSWFYLQHNIRFLQEILQNRKSDFLEWLIIILIGAEILISVYDIFHKSSITSL